MAPDGEQLAAISMTFEVPEPRRPGSRPHLNLGFPIANVLFPEAGPYNFSVLIGDDLKATVPLYISIREGETE